MAARPARPSCRTSSQAYATVDPSRFHQPAPKVDADADADAHTPFFKPPKENENAAFARRVIRDQLQWIWSILAVYLNGYERCLVEFADKQLKEHGKDAEKLHENDAYMSGLRERGLHTAASAGKTYVRAPGSAEELDALNTIRRARAAKSAARPSSRNVLDNHQTQGRGLRRFSGDDATDRHAELALAEARRCDSDGLSADQATITTLRRLSELHDQYAATLLENLLISSGSLPMAPPTPALFPTRAPLNPRHLLTATPPLRRDGGVAPGRDGARARLHLRAQRELQILRHRLRLQQRRRRHHRHHAATPRRSLPD